MGAYTRDVAYVQDRGFGFFARQATPGMLQILRRHGIRSGRVAELGCGSGIWAAALTEKGYEYWGIDLSPDILRLARKAAPSGKFVAGSLFDAEIPPCDAVLSCGECLNYRTGPLHTLRTMRRLFRRVYAALRPGGIFLFDFAEPGQTGAGDLGRTHLYGDGWVILLEHEEDGRRKTLTRYVTCFRRQGELYRRTDEVHHLRLYRRQELARLLLETGFRVRRLTGYGRLRMPPGHCILLARKPDAR